MPPKGAPRRHAAAKPPAKTSTKTSTKTTPAPAVKKTEPAAATAAAAPAKPIQTEPYVVVVKDIKTELVEDASNKIRGSGRAALVIDNEAGIAGRFLQYSGCVMLEGANILKGDMQENIRQAAVNSVRQGKPLVIDLDVMGITQFEAISAKFDEVESGLLGVLLDRSIMENEWYRKIIRDSDGEGYQSHYWLEDNMKKFFVLVLSRVQAPSPELKNKFFWIQIE